MAEPGTVATTDIVELPLINRGKVRDVYEVDENTLLIVATDRISAFDCVMPTQIPYKGRILTQISAFWFDRLKSKVGTHLISTSIDDMPDPVRIRPELDGRSMLVRKADVFPVECVVRGYLEGSGWKDYLESGSVCGHKLASGLLQCSKLETPLFTPATKAKSGHDKNIDFETFSTIVGNDNAERLRGLSLEIYRSAAEYAETKGIIIADTKFEFGLTREGGTILIDEALTPDSSRFWESDNYAPGKAQRSYDKQFLREYLESLDWNKKPPAPELPIEIVEATTQRYLDAYKMLTGKDLEE